MSEVNTDLASGNFQNNGVVQPSLDFVHRWQYCALGVKLGLNWDTMYNLEDLVKYQDTYLVRKL